MTPIDLLAKLLDEAIYTLHLKLGRMPAIHQLTKDQRECLEFLKNHINCRREIILPGWLKSYMKARKLIKLDV
jgi:hypothetical protein